MDLKVVADLYHPILGMLVEDDFHALQHLRSPRILCVRSVLSSMGRHLTAEQPLDHMKGRVDVASRKASSREGPSDR